MRKPRRQVWARIAIAVSVALNLFLLAFVGAQAWRSNHPSVRQGPFATNDLGSGMLAVGYLRQITSTLPEADRRALREAYAAEAPTLISLGLQLRAAAERVGADIAAQPLDLDQVKRDMAATQASRQEIGGTIQAILLDVLPRLSDEGRRALGGYRLQHRDETDR